jgi:membrane-associated phospholipid phosphatase
MLVYYSTAFIVGDGPRYSAALPWDSAIPLIPAWIIVYYGCYVSWFWGYIIAARQNDKLFYGFFVRVFFSLIVAFLFFTLFPLEISRPEITEPGFFNSCVRFLYSIDRPFNLLPSLHCFYNWMIYVQIRGRKEYPLALRIFIFLLALAVFASTLFMRQHYILDIVVAVLLVELSGLLLKTPLPRIAERIFTRVNEVVFTKKVKEKTK